jgi:hypothetical protein
MSSRRQAKRIKARANGWIKEAGIAPILGGQTQAAMEFRQRLLLDYVDEALKAYDIATSQGLDDPIVLIIDARDTKGGEIGKALYPDGYAQLMTDRKPGDGVPVLTLSVDRPLVVKMLKYINPNTASEIAEARKQAGVVTFVLMAMGGSLAGSLTPP